MIDVYIFFIFLTISLIFIILGFLKNQYALIVLAGILFLVLGAVFLKGLNYTTGSNVSLITGNNYSVTDTTTTYNTEFRFPFSAFLFLIGLGMLFIGIAGSFKTTKEEVSYEDDEGEE